MKTFSLFIFLIFFLFIGNNCHYTDVAVTAKSEFILPSDSGTIYRLKKRYFILAPGDTALLYGTRSCTTLVNGTITKSLNDSVYYRTITKELEVMKINDTPHLVYPQLYQEASSISKLSKNSITRYFEKDSVATLQLAYKEKGSLNYIEKSNQWVVPVILEIGPYGWFQSDTTKVPKNNLWPISPLIRNPLTYTKGNVIFKGHSVATKPICLPNSGEPQYNISGVNYGNGVFIKSYHSISGEIEEKGKSIRVVGSIIITRSYFTDRGLVDQLKKTFIQKFYSDGGIETKKEIVYVMRGPEGAKNHPEYDTLSYSP